MSTRSLAELALVLFCVGGTAAMFGLQVALDRISAVADAVAELVRQLDAIAPEPSEWEENE